MLEQTVDRKQRAVFLKELVITGGKVPLAMVRKRLASNAGGTRAPVLLVHGFGQNRYAWHLPARSFSNYLACAGFDVFNLDLRGHGRSLQFGAASAHDVHDYIAEDLPSAVAEVRQHSGHRAVFLVGHSLGGLVSYGAAPLLAEAVGGVASLGSPYHFTRGSLTLRAIALGFDGLRRAGLPHRRVSAPLYPVGRLIRTLRRVADSPFYPLPVRGWRAGALEPHVLEQHLRLAFDRAGMAELRNMFEWATARRFGGPGRDYVERFEAMNRPLLVVSGANDDLAPPVGVRPAFERSRSTDKTYRTVPHGHIDLLVGRDAPATTWPLVAHWLLERAA